VAMRDVAADRLLAEAGVDDGRIGRRDRDRADGAAEEAVGHRFPRLPAVDSLPNAATRGAEVVNLGLAGDALNGGGAPATIRPDLAPLHVLEEGGVGGGCGEDRGGEEKQKKTACVFHGGRMFITKGRGGGGRSAR